MSTFTETQRKAIIEILERHAAQNVAVFDGINKQKLTNAVDTFGDRIVADEVIFLQYDGTVWGSARDGFLMTNLGIHSKNMWEPAQFVTYANIRSLTLRKTTMTVEVTVRDDFNINLTHTAKQIHALLEELLPLAQKGFVQPTSEKPAVKDQRCSGCGAPTHSVQNNCEYCGSPL